MRRVLFVATATAFTLSISGCGFINSLFGGEETPVGETPTTESPVVVSPIPEETPAEQATGEPAETPPGTPTATLPSDLDLIPSTNPEQRLQAIESERADPFSLVPTTPNVQLPPPSERSAAQPPAAPTGGGQATGGQAPATRTPGQAGNRAPSAQPSTNRAPGQSPGGLAPIPNLVPQPPSPTVATRPSPPPPPQPNLARAVEVLGVVQVGNTRYAIVNAPNEPSSRYVREGQQLPNGEVVVRRIEVNGPEPVVVFEQYGIEVITAVGGGGAPESAGTSPAAAVPASTSGRQPG